MSELWIEREEGQEMVVPQNSGDVIYRQAAIDAILHNQAVYSNNFGNDPIDKYTIAIIDNDAQTIAQLPSVQPEIIRCKDCAAYGEMLAGIDTRMICHKFALNFSQDFYCADAKRRTDEA